MISALGKKIKQDGGIINKDDGKGMLGAMGHIIIRVLEEASEERYWFWGKTGVDWEIVREKYCRDRGNSKGQVQRCAKAKCPWETKARRLIWLHPKRGARGKVGNIMRKREVLSAHTELLRSLAFILSEMVSCGHFWK